MCPGADAGLTSDAARVVTGSPCTCGVPCEAIPCSYVCNEGYTPSEGACVIEAVSPPAIQLVDDGDGTVTVIDASAQLVWLRDANCLDTVGGIARPDGRASWAEATAWAAGLADGSCGLRDGSVPGDWGLPTQTELMHLQVDLAAGGPFANVQLDTYWSSFSYFAANAGAVDMYDGQYFDYPKDSLAYVWPIRH